MQKAQPAVVTSQTRKTIVLCINTVILMILIHIYFVSHQVDNLKTQHVNKPVRIPRKLQGFDDNEDTYQKRKFSYVVKIEEKPRLKHSIYGDYLPETETHQPRPTLNLSNSVGSTDLRKPTNCSKIASRDQLEFERSRNILKLSRPKISDYSFIQWTQNCSDFLHKRGYHMHPLSEEEKKFPLAFSIRLHRSAEQAERLLRAIYMPQNVYCIYIDLKSLPVIHSAMKGIASCLPNVFIASKLKVFNYATFSPVEADLQCMRELLGTPVPWRYYINLAGQEFPLKTNYEVVQILKYLNGTNDIESYPFPEIQKWRTENRYEVDINKGEPVRTSVAKEPFKGGSVPLFKGSAYNTFSRPFVEWVLRSSFAADLFEWSKDTFSPDETVWATLVRQPGAPGGYSVTVTQTAGHHISRHIIWSWGNGYCFGKYVREICIFSFRDLGWLLSRWELFANKFDLDFDHIILDCLESALQERQRHQGLHNSKLRWDFYSHLPHVKCRRKK